MKYCVRKLLLLSAFFIPSFAHSQKSPSSIMELAVLSDDTTILNTLRVLDKKLFIGKEVGGFLEEKTVSCYLSKAFVAHPANSLSYLLLSYGNNISIHIVPEVLKFQSKFNRYNRWDFELFKKEKIADIILFYKDVIVK